MYNSHPRHPRNIQWRNPFARVEWDVSRLDKLSSSGFIEAYIAAADLMMQQQFQIKTATILPSLLCSTRFTNQILQGFVRSDRVKAFASHPTQSLANVEVRVIPSHSYVRAELLWHSTATGNSPGQTTATLRDYNVHYWYESWSIPTHWVVREWQLQLYDLPEHACVRVFYSTFAMYWWVANCICDASILYYGITESAFRPSTDMCSNYQTIREQDVQGKVRIWYMIFCGCGLILIRSVTGQYRTGINTITIGIRGNHDHAHSFRMYLAKHFTMKIIETKCGYIPRSFSKEVTLFRQWNEQALAAKQSKSLPAKKPFIYYCVFMIFISIIITPKIY